ncbi:MAG: hypothetical protein IPJ98_13625 [Bryobacterales bacterium]|nr:hypothetical protein [Bryobacterales bacterium]
MDAKIGGWVVTPRSGKPVEIQALWHNALCVMRDLSRQFGEGERALFLGQLAARAQSSFAELFWNESAGGLYDVVNGAERDASVRPNQIFAVSLHHALLEGERARRWWIWCSGSCGRRKGCGRWRVAMPCTRGAMAGTFGRATRRITRVRCGRGCLGLSLRHM